MNIPFVDLKSQYAGIRDEVAEAVQGILDNTAFIGGKPVKDFEEAFARMEGARFAVGTSSGTSSLHVALEAAGVGPGDEVITVPNTFIATAESISQCGAKFRFVDIEPLRHNMDPAKIEAAITPKTKAIVPVHLYGQPADMDPILAIAKKHDLLVIADSAQGHCATYNGKKMGELCLASTYSFYPGKNLGAYGDAGALVTNDEALAKKAAQLIDHGRSGKYEHNLEGYNYRLDGIQAAILHVKLGYIQKWTEARRAAASRYRERLASLPIEVNQEAKDSRHVYHIFSVFHEERDRLREGLEAKGIAAGIHYPIPLHLQEAYADRGYAKGDFPVAEKSAATQLSLPIFPELTKDQIDHVVDTLGSLL
ncbi:MAG: DegT/DnrJ/EryC1/StrS family aminotransferase [Gemmatimonadetes bacterium]|nr:DegT/DnrJ/EryC1/StrS family aminotransferase [Gemmatimonadota bacterium]